MKNIITICIWAGVLCCACGPDDETSTNTLLENKVSVDSKINGGSILSTFLLTGSDTESFDMPGKTNAKWISLSPIVNIRKDKEGRLYFDVSKAANIPLIIANIKDKGADKFMLKPMISFEILGYDFWGDYKAASEKEWQEVEFAFKALLLAYAETSKKNPEVKILCIGNELFHFTKKRPDFFRKMAVLIRKQYPKLKLTYAANWNEYEHITFWDSLDYIGINPYFPLVNKATPEVSEIETAYKPIKIKLSNLSATENKPILFTEYGFRSVDFATWKTWELPDIYGGKHNPKVQVNAYQALYDTFWKEKWMAGGFFWQWKARFFFGNPIVVNSNWGVNHKPVLKVIKTNYLQ